MESEVPVLSRCKSVSPPGLSCNSALGPSFFPHTKFCDTLNGKLEWLPILRQASGGPHSKWAKVSDIFHYLFVLSEEER